MKQAGRKAPAGEEVDNEAEAQAAGCHWGTIFIGVWVKLLWNEHRYFKTLWLPAGAQAISKEEVLRVARQVLTLDDYTMATIHP